MYGPPPDPREIAAPAGPWEDPAGWAACIAIGLALTLLALWRRPPVGARAFLFVLGQTVALTAPLAAHLEGWVYGAYPTLDKEGSLLFYLDGVHVRALLHPLASLSDPAVRLVGAQTGHLWVTALLDLFLSPTGALNAQALLYPALAWFAAFLLLRDLCGDARVAVVVGFAWGLGLHVFRDLNWGTIEKSSIFWLALHGWALHRAWRDGGRWPWISGAILGLAAWMNLYWGAVGGLVVGTLAAGALVRRLRGRAPPEELGRLGLALGAGLLFLAPLAAWQVALMRAGPPLASPADYLWKRAALDAFTLFPPRWDRLEVHRALNLVVVGLALFGAVAARRDVRVRGALLVALASFLLSLGPELAPGRLLLNPVYLAVRAVVPGFWRVAKPEVFFHATWLALSAVAAIQLVRAAPRRGGLGLLYAIFVVAWVAMVRTHPAFPGMSLPVEGRLDPHWAERVFRTP